MHLHSFMWGWSVALHAMAMVQLDDETRDELRRYKAEYGDTYTEAVERLLSDTGWYNE